MDRLELMEQFVRIAESRSLSGAARAQGCGEPTVSKHLTRLEEALGARLVLRGAHGVRLTEVGERYLTACKRLLGELRDVEESLTDLRRTLSGSLRLLLPVTLGEVYLTRVVLEFQRQHPALRVELVLADGWADLAAAGADLAVRVGAVLDPSVVAKSLGGYRSVLVASPAYLDAAGAPATPQDLATHEYLRFGRTQEESLSSPEGPTSLRVQGALSFNNSLAVKTAALAGAGIGRVARWLVEEELLAGHLREVLPGVAPPPVPVFATYLPSHFPTEKVRGMIRCFAQSLPRLPGWIPPAELSASLGGAQEVPPPPS